MPDRREGTCMSGRICLKVMGAVGQILIDRPEKMNAITPEMTRDLQRVCHEIDGNHEIRVATIMGAGERAFCAGSDLNLLGDVSDVIAFRDRIEYAALVRGIRKPVIAGLKGWVLGGGMEIALAADFRVAGRSARIGGPEVTRGWIGGGGASQMLPRLVGIGQAMRLLLTGDPADAETAHRIGLIEEVVDDLQVEERVLEVARKIASFAPLATQAVKAGIRAAQSMPLEQGLRYENELHVLCMSDKARVEGVKAFQEKREAKF
jgi:enoyl-CoA hydratase